SRGRQGTEAHTGDGDGDVQLDGPGPVPPTEQGPGLAALAVPLERIPRGGGGEEEEVVEARRRPAGAQAPDGVLPGVGHLVDPVDDLGGEGGAGRRGWH